MARRKVYTQQEEFNRVLHLLERAINNICQNLVFQCILVGTGPDSADLQAELYSMLDQIDDKLTTVLENNARAKKKVHRILELGLDD